LVITHPFHPLNGQRLVVLFTQRKRTGLYFVCEVEGRRPVTVAQEWTDRGVPASPDRLAVEGLTAARALVNAIDTVKVEQRSGVTRVDEEEGQRRGTGADVGLGSPPGGDGGGEHGRVAAARRTRR
jgi:Family of unknown function (DUF5372)